MCFLSIIIPCYNVENYIDSTLNSLSLLKEAEDCEFIFVNDGSTDATLEKITNFVENDNRSILINQTNQGVSAARNAALKQAKGQFVLCLDGDDYLHPETILIIKNNLQQDADALLAPCIIKQSEIEKKRPLNIQDGVYSVEQLYASCRIFPTAPMMVYRNSIIHDTSLQFNSNIKSGEVYDFTVSFLEKAHKIAVTNIGFYYYVMRNSSATHRPNYTADLSVLQIMDHFSSIPNQWSKSPSFLLTELKMITSFTYNKYIRNHLTNSDTIGAIETVLSNPNFKNLLTTLRTSPIDIKHKIYVYYLKYMPHKIGYKLCVCCAKIIKTINYLLHPKKSSNFVG
jgi:glycosyltransferase involved in cell wall biosynthesis